MKTEGKMPTVQERIEKVANAAWKAYAKEVKEFPLTERSIMMYAAEIYHNHMKAIYTDGFYIDLLQKDSAAVLLATDAHVRSYIKRNSRKSRSRVRVHMYRAIIAAVSEHFRAAIKAEFIKPGRQNN